MKSSTYIFAAAPPNIGVIAPDLPSKPPRLHNQATRRSSSSPLIPPRTQCQRSHKIKVSELQSFVSYHNRATSHHITFSHRFRPLLGLPFLCPSRRSDPQTRRELVRVDSSWHFAVPHVESKHMLLLLLCTSSSACFYCFW